ncbi:hypothetical protein GWI33_001556 [Rhynchophorus ferrugineus]|uniref:Uncharacterized protein n=1 Tax=Rhynchophorus ferrugineus TaxID=354439 RepID=A0A834HN09_RHYFE|nr:hypothetical protein GWI33_001556 [Rhynchophorus ferrugineus]
MKLIERHAHTILFGAVSKLSEIESADVVHRPSTSALSPDEGEEDAHRCPIIYGRFVSGGGLRVNKAVEMRNRANKMDKLLSINTGCRAAEAVRELTAFAVAATAGEPRQVSGGLRDAPLKRYFSLHGSDDRDKNDLINTSTNLLSASLSSTY